MKRTVYFAAIYTLASIPLTLYANEPMNAAMSDTPIEQETAVQAAPATMHKEMHDDMQQAATPTEMMEEKSGFSSGSVVRSAFTSEIANREPTDKLEQATTDAEKIVFFTELRDMSGQVAKHRWEHNGKVMAEVEFKVNGPRWRVWSSKKIMPEQSGDWKVSVINSAGEVISEKSLTLSEATQMMHNEGAMPAMHDEMAPATEQAPAAAQ